MTATEDPDTADGAELRVSPLELFFDLVFVFTITQLTALLEHGLSPTGLLQVVLIFVVLFWMYGGYVWLTNQLPPVVAARRLLLICGMAAFLICALAIPRAFDAAGLAFGIGYLLVVLVHAGLYGQGYGRAVWRFVPLNIVGALCVLSAAVVDGELKYALWVAPIGLQYLSSMLSSRIDASSRAGFDIRPAHFVERHGLLLIVAFGESVVAIGIGLGDTELGPSVLGAAVLGLVLAAALWWTYFGEDEQLAEARLTAAPLTDRLRKALGAYFYAYIAILLGVVTLSAGLHLAIGDITARLDGGTALLLGGGVALYLTGNVLFRRALQISPIRYRVAVAALAMATIALGVGLSALTQLVGLVVALVVMLIVEERGRRSDSRRGRLAGERGRPGPPDIDRSLAGA